MCYGRLGLPVVRPVERKAPGNAGGLLRCATIPGMSHSGEAPITFVRGDSRTFRIVFRNTETKEPIDITGALILSQIRESADASVVMATGVGSVTDGPNGAFQVVYSSSETQGLTGNGRFDIQMTLPDGTVRTLWPNRKAKVILDVSK